VTDHVQEAAALWVIMTEAVLALLAALALGGVVYAAWHALGVALGSAWGRIQAPDNAPWRDDEHPSWKGRGGWRDD
jgi:tetrahydromethanopterin S-methyltransferase subunit E